MEQRFREFYLREVAIASHLRLHSPGEGHSAKTLKQFLATYTTFDALIAERIALAMAAYTKERDNICRLFGASSDCNGNGSKGSSDGEEDDDIDEETYTLRMELATAMLPPTLKAADLDHVFDAEARLTTFLRELVRSGV